MNETPTIHWIINTNSENLKFSREEETYKESPNIENSDPEHFDYLLTDVTRSIKDKGHSLHYSVWSKRSGVNL